MFTDGMNITVSPSFNSIVAAFGISVFIGVLFGYLPAKRARGSTPLTHSDMINLSEMRKALPLRKDFPRPGEDVAQATQGGVCHRR